MFGSGWNSKLPSYGLKRGRRTRLAVETLESRDLPGVLATNSLLEGASAGSDSVILTTTDAWTATSNDSWLHTTASDTGSSVVDFTFDANTGATRTGTLTIDGLTLSVTQAGSNYTAANPIVTLVGTSGPTSPFGVAVDSSGNVYFSDTANNVVKEYVAATGTVQTLASGLDAPNGVALDSAGNVYIADFSDGSVKEYVAATGTVQTLASGLDAPNGVAVDSSGNVYISDLDNTVKEYVAATGMVTTLVSTGLSFPDGVAVDGAGNVYIADTNNNAVKEYVAATGMVNTLLSVFNRPYGVAVDSSGNVYIADSGSNAVDEYVASTKGYSSLAFRNVIFPTAVAVDSAGNVYAPNGRAVEELVRAYVPKSPVTESYNAGADQLAVVLPSTQSLTGLFAPTSNQSWLTITDTNNGIVSFSYTANTSAIPRTALVTVLGRTITVTQAGIPNLGTSTLVEGPSAGSDSVILTTTDAWTATSNDSWLHTTASGTGNGLVTFTFDQNTGATRTGTLTIDGLTLSVTQAGSNYSAVNPITTLVSTGLNRPYGVAVDNAGNVYIADAANGAVKEYVASTGVVQTLASTAPSFPRDVAVDSVGNVYIADTQNNAVDEYVAATGTLTTLVSTGLHSPLGVAVDSAGNVYIADTNDGAVKEYVAATGTVTTIASGLGAPAGVAVDSAGNIYIVDALTTLKEYVAATGTVTTLVSTGLDQPYGLAVDSSGNVYITDELNGTVKEYVAATGTVQTLASRVRSPFGVAVDNAGNVYFSDTTNNAVRELVRAFVPTSPVTLSNTAGSGQLSVVFPSTESLTGLFAPTSDQSWLTITSTNNGIVSYSYAANTGTTSRTAHITVLGQTITVTQAGIPHLGTSALVEGPAMGTDSVELTTTDTWTATSNDSWLHTTASGTGNGLVTFTFDQNTGATRTGTLTIDGFTLSVTQAGSNYTAVNPITTLVSGVTYPDGVAVDSSGNVYFTDSNNVAVKEYVASTGMIQTLVSTGLQSPLGLAVDSSGNVYIADYGNNAVFEYVAATGSLTTLVSGLNHPEDVAVDSDGNVYIADALNDPVKEYVAATGVVQTLASGLNQSDSVAVDSSGNVYIADELNSTVKEYVAATGTVQTLVSTGLAIPFGVAVDGSGNVYITDTLNHALKEYVAATGVVQTLVSRGVSDPQSVVVDSLGNVYFADVGHGVVKELVRAFVPTSPVTLSNTAGSGQLSVVFPNTESLTGLFAPTSDQSWLTITDTNNGIVSYSYTANTSAAARTAHITVLGQTITVTQAGIPHLGTSALVEGPAMGTDSVELTTTDTWTATSNASWLHTTASGTGNSVVTFTFDSNTGATRTGTLTIDGLTLSVTQAGSNYSAANLVTKLVSSGLSSPQGVAVDGSGNVYIADSFGDALKEYVAATGTVQTLVSTGPSLFFGVALDSAGNVYIADANSSSTVKEYVAATGTLTTLVSSGLSSPQGVAVDGSGNVYIADAGNNAVKEYVASTGTINTLPVSGLDEPFGLAVDSSGNVYIADRNHSAVKELVRAYVPTSPVTLTDAAGSSQLSVVLPSTQSLTGIFAPTSDQSWLTITDTSNGIVSYSYTANTSTTPRTAHITLLGQSITLTQAAPPAIIPAAPETSLSGVVFLDYNDNGALDSGDMGLAGQTVFVDLNGTGILEANDPSTATDANGAYTLDLLGMPAGSYTVEVALTALEQATGSPLVVTIPDAVPMNANLGVRPTSTILPITASSDLFQPPTPAKSNAAFIQSLYQAVLGRDPGTTEIGGNPIADSKPDNPFTSTVDSRDAIAAGLFQSAEYLKDEVDSFYQTYLGRQADSGGEGLYISLLQRGMDPRQVVIMLVTSAEYTSEHADASDYVQSLYRTILGRTGSTSEINLYVQLLANGMSRAAVARGILYSTEAAELTVNAFYAQFLQRSADATGLAMYESQLESGVNPSLVAAEILASAEFFNRASNA